MQYSKLKGQFVDTGKLDGKWVDAGGWKDCDSIKKSWKSMSRFEKLKVCIWVHIFPFSSKFFEISYLQTPQPLHENYCNPIFFER